EEERLAAFVAEAPNAEYVLDAPLLCRPRSSQQKDARGTTCLRSSLDAKSMFARMQALGFFCQLSPEPENTQLICRRL
ncbi:hypothetical protein THASP1DRAFT_2590, partial [Thamnocephalis sphaerospora]